MRVEQTERLRVMFLGIIILLLVLGGLIVFVINPASAKDLWLIIGPIISAAAIGLLQKNQHNQKD